MEIAFLSLVLPLLSLSCVFACCCKKREGDIGWKKRVIDYFCISPLSLSLHFFISLYLPLPLSSPFFFFSFFQNSCCGGVGGSAAAAESLSASDDGGGGLGGVIGLLLLLLLLLPLLPTGPRSITPAVPTAR